VAVGEPLQAQLQEALATAGVQITAPELPVADEADPAEIVRFGPTQDLLLRLFEWTQDEADAVQAGDTLTKKLKRLHRKVSADLKIFDTLDDPARHRLRKRAKRLRYGVEFASGLFDKRQLQRYLEALKDLQDTLGAVVDVSIAMQAYRTLGDDDPAVLFSLGWLAARKTALSAEVGSVTKAFRKAPTFWKSG
jgi:inorganic triphosphatase YgiF